ncbi:sigma-70 family RNA polymerase sigma factor [Mesorhizobium sp. B2-4-12]|uniref:sigma-70 family RNA polymerase sigma factor n=1 Tax=unclassified Mesorhizobium TaxID=325217 RepID=UPI00112AEED5|nr:MULTISPECIES: sigma-70 family RNA polymerase sigma factor [unclassified Mesorhizobium]TPK88490.1 sigma-70 family RNA polymerase sigma factor [Mesorhizobium sp. B2-4-17]TPK94734.1 sigma-70 family RNA polymerase sigma factor [Mesorhizobium sp. B2-4-12]
MNTEEFEDRLKALRPRLHRYCARMTGSAISGEDVLQDALVKALHARAQGAEVDNLEGWLFRIAHNASLDFLRGRSRNTVVPLTENIEAAPMPEADIVAISFQTFLRLPELQRCAVILRDVLGHSVEEIAGIAECSPAAAKSALQRGRVALRQLAETPEDTRLPLMSDTDRRKIAAFVDLFRGGDFDAIRAMLADDVKLELVNRLHLEGRGRITPYFTRYAEVTKWRFALGAVEGQPAMLVFDSTGPMDRPAHFVLVDWSENRIIGIRDFLFAPYVLEATDWVQLG